MGAHGSAAFGPCYGDPYLYGGLPEVLGVNYLPFVSHGTYGGTTPKEIANYGASWGLMRDLPLEEVLNILQGATVEPRFFLSSVSFRAPVSTVEQRAFLSEAQI
jgi:hypothetical protein